VGGSRKKDRKVVTRLQRGDRFMSFSKEKEGERGQGRGFTESAKEKITKGGNASHTNIFNRRRKKKGKFEEEKSTVPPSFGIFIMRRGVTYDPIHAERGEKRRGKDKERDENLPASSSGGAFFTPCEGEGGEMGRGEAGRRHAPVAESSPSKPRGGKGGGTRKEKEVFPFPLPGQEGGCASIPGKGREEFNNPEKKQHSPLSYGKEMKSRGGDSLLIYRID